MKFLMLAGITALVAVALAVLGVTLVFAQEPFPASPNWWTEMRNRMQTTGRSDSWQSMWEMHRLMTRAGGVSAVHETAWKALAYRLGTTPGMLVKEIESGKTMAQISEEAGANTSDLASTLRSSMLSGLAQAIEEGTLTQDQADRLLEQMDGRYEWMIENMGAGWMGTSPGGCHSTPPQGNDL